MTFDAESHCIEELAINVLEEGRFEEAVALWGRTRGVRDLCGRGEDSDRLRAQLFEARLRYLTLGNNEPRLLGLLRELETWIEERDAWDDNWLADGFKPIELPDSMLVGNPRIDAEHVKLVALANEVRKSLEAQDFEGSLERVKVYVAETKAHFRTEEEELLRTGYAHAERHARYHDKLMGKADAIVALCESLVCGEVTSKALYRALVSFLLNDPIAADMEFKDHFALRIEDGGLTAL